MSLKLKSQITRHYYPADTAAVALIGTVGE